MDLQEENLRLKIALASMVRQFYNLAGKTPKL